MKLHRNEKYFKWGLTAFLVIVAGVLFWILFSRYESGEPEGQIQEII